MNRIELNRRSVVAGGLGMAGIMMLGGLGRAIAADATPGAVVDTSYGKLRGVTSDGVQIFRGVPYAATTAGGRFMPPKKPVAWTGVRDAANFGGRSPQLPSPLLEEIAAFQGSDPQSEDCLFLNIWTPANDGKKRPVMVWCHGGGFSSGSGASSWFDGTALAKKHDVVLVTINHRLGIFGYLYLAQLGGAEFADSGNVGMLDIVAALQYVHDNIAHFGGDAGNVTLFGQSGGGGKVSTIMAMPGARGLFHRAIVESGSGTRGLKPEDATKAAKQLLEQVSPGATNVDVLVKATPEQLLAALKAINTGAGPHPNFSPVVDGRSVPHPFGGNEPASPVSADIPLLIGSTATETTFFNDPTVFTIDASTLHDRVKQRLKLDDARTDHLIDIYKRASPDATPSKIYLLIDSDAWMRMEAINQAERHVAAGKASAYMYYFTWESPVRGGKLGSVHTLEIPFVFDHVDLATGIVGTGPERQALADQMSAAWVAFARGANPNHAGMPQWPAYTPDRRATMVFNNTVEEVEDPGKEKRLAFAQVKPLRS